MPSEVFNPPITMPLDGYHDILQRMSTKKFNHSYQQRIDRSASYIFYNELYFLCQECRAHWTTREPEMLRFRKIPCPDCGEPTLNLIFVVKLQGFREEEDLIEFTETINDESAKWDQVDELAEHKHRYTPPNERSTRYGRFSEEKTKVVKQRAERYNFRQDKFDELWRGFMFTPFTRRGYDLRERLDSIKRNREVRKQVEAERRAKRKRKREGRDD